MLTPTYFRILPACTRYTGIDYNAEYEYLGLTTGRAGDIMLKVGILEHDLTFYPNEVQQVMKGGKGEKSI